jgi:hypothetical protein
MSSVIWSDQSPQGPFPTAEEKKAIKQWDKDDTMVIGWLLATMEPHINDLMSYQNTSRQIWEKVATRFARKKNFARIYQIQQEINQIQHTSQTTSELFNQLQQKRDEIRVYRPPTVDLDELRRREEQDEIFLFLAKLDPSYEAVRFQILLSTDLPTLDEVAAMIEGEETCRAVMGHHTPANPEGQAFGATAKPPAKLRYPRTEPTMKCDHCKKDGHTNWFLHPELRPQGQRRGRRAGDGGDARWKKGFVVEVQGPPGGEKEEDSIPINTQYVQASDQMQHLLNQLSVLLNQNRKDQRLMVCV